MIAYALAAERCVVFLLACWDIRWSFVGALALVRGNFWPPAFYGSVVFWTAAAALSFDLAHMFGSADLWRALSLLLLITALAVAAIARHRGALLRAEQFYGIYDHLEEALAIAGLAEIDPAAARRLAEESRRLAAAALMMRNA